MAGSEAHSYRLVLYPKAPWAADWWKAGNFLSPDPEVWREPTGITQQTSRGDKVFPTLAVFLGGKPVSLKRERISIHWTGREQCKALQPFFLRLFRGTQITSKDSRPA